MIPFTFSCVVLTIVPLLGELLMQVFHLRLRSELLDPAALRPLALLTGAAYAFVLLLRGILSDFQVLTLVALIVSLVTALMESLAAGSSTLQAGYALSATLTAMSTFVQGTFFAAAAVAGWLALEPPGKTGLRRPRPSEPQAVSLMARPPRFLLLALSMLAVAHFLLPLDLILQSAIQPADAGNNHAGWHAWLRIGLWCLAAIWLVIGAIQALGREEEASQESDPP